MTDSEAAKGKWSDAAKSRRKQDVPSLDSVCSTLQAEPISEVVVIVVEAY